MTGRHEHTLASPDEWPWLPARPGGPIFQHPYCKECGLVKAIGSHRPMKDGDLVNIVAALSDRFTATGRKVSQAQRRLIHRELETAEAGDAFAYTKEGQIALLVGIYSRYTGVPPEVVCSHMEDL